MAKQATLPIEMSVWQRFLGIENLSEYLSIFGIALTVLGFTITVIAAVQAKRAAEAARDAAEAAAKQIRKIDLISEVATVLQLIEELKRLQRAKAVEVLPDRYSGLRSKMISIRESSFLAEAENQALIQDVIARIAALQKSLDRNNGIFEDGRQLARSNESLSACTDAVLRLNERVKTHLPVNL